MKEFRTGSAIVRVHGNEPEGLKEATEIFMKKVMMCRRKKEKLNGKESSGNLIISS